MKPSATLKNDSILQDCGVGTRFGKGEPVRMKLTHKDLILVAGIVVAIIIALTTWIVDSNLSFGNVEHNMPGLVKSPSPAVLINKVGNALFK